VVFEIEITAKAEHDLDAIVSYYRRQILDGIEQHLSYRPKQESVHGLNGCGYLIRQPTDCVLVTTGFITMSMKINGS
jgi:hypothetical protein